jgi:hypothetical protein
MSKSIIANSAKGVSLPGVELPPEEKKEQPPVIDKTEQEENIETNERNKNNLAAGMIPKPEVKRNQNEIFKPTNKKIQLEVKEVAKEVTPQRSGRGTDKKPRKKRVWSDAAKKKNKEQLAAARAKGHAVRRAKKAIRDEALRKKVQSKLDKKADRVIAKKQVEEKMKDADNKRIEKLAHQMSYDQFAGYMNRYTEEVQKKYKPKVQRTHKSSITRRVPVADTPKPRVSKTILRPPQRSKNIWDDCF